MKSAQTRRSAGDENRARMGRCQAQDVRGVQSNMASEWLHHRTMSVAVSHAISTRSPLACAAGTDTVRTNAQEDTPPSVCCNTEK